MSGDRQHGRTTQPLTVALFCVIWGAGALTGTLATDTLGYTVSVIPALAVMVVGACLFWRGSDGR